MKLEGEQVLFRIFLKSEKKYQKIIPLYRYLFKKLRDKGLAGATIIKSFISFLGSNDNISMESFFRTSSSAICLEVVDEPEKINRFISEEWKNLEDLILTSERARVILYSSDKENRQIEKKNISFIETSKDSRKNEIMIKNQKEKVLIRAFIGDSEREKVGNKYLYEFIIEKAKELNFLLAFSYRGIMGFGRKSRLRDLETIEFSSNMPICVELIGDDDNVKKIIDILNTHMESGLITVEKINVYYNPT